MKQRIPLIISLCLIFSIVVVLVSGVLNSWQAGMPMPGSVRLVDGEFSTDGGASWQPLGNRRELRKANGDLILRGKLDTEVGEGWLMNLRIQHMKLEVLVNGEIIYVSGPGAECLRPEWCADQWVSFSLPNISASDTLEFRLYKQHDALSPGIAYDELTKKILIGDPLVVHHSISEENLVERLFGQVLLVAGVTLLGVGLAAFVMKSPLKRILLYTAFLSIGEGAYWTIDAMPVMESVGHSVAMYSLGLSMSLVLIMYSLLAGVAELLLRRSNRASRWLAAANGVISLGFLFVSLITGVPFCRYEMTWCLVQLPFVLAMFILCIPEIRQRKYTVRHRFFILAHMLVFVAILITAAAYMLDLEAGANIARIVSGVVTLFYASALFIQLPASHAAVQNAKKMSEQLNQSRIVLAMSQISTHFIFNVLNSISGLLKIDPEMADAELIRFARYLRTNIDIMQEDKPITFEKEIEHVHNYMDLEQLRFDDKIMVDENYEVMDFVLPSLVVQPLVENAIKHGLLPKAEGGLIRMSTYRQGREVVIEIADNGVGFQANKTSTHNSVGLSNVRYRLEKMAGGRLEIESAPGAGTVVKAILPYQKGE